jgi:sialidase-1
MKAEPLDLNIVKVLKRDGLKVLWFYVCATAIICLLSTSGSASEAHFEARQLFAATGTNYYHVPGLVVTSKGTVLAYASWRDVAGVDWNNNRVVMRRSTDGGKTWDLEQEIAPAGAPVQAFVRTSPPKPKGHEDFVTVDNGMMVPDTNGVVHMVYCVEYHQVFYQSSHDDGLSWSKPVEITPALEKYRQQMNWKIVATGPGHGIQLKNGRLVIPVWLAGGGKEGYHHAPTMVGVLYSDDHGTTWNGGDVVAKTTGRGDNPEVYHNPNESAAVQLADGRVLFNIRAGSARHRRLQSVSADGATAWPKPAFIEDLPEPIVFGSLARLSEIPRDDKNRLLFSIDTGAALNKKTEQYDEQKFKREDIAVFVSYDEGKTWPVKKVIQQGPGGAGYSDLAVLPDGTILCAYGSGPPFGRGAGISVARFNLEWLTDKADSFARKNYRTP